jgi:uncharacterized protein (UPF0261 family)
VNSRAPTDDRVERQRQITAITVGRFLSASAVAAAGGTSLEALRVEGDRGKSVAAMAKGAAAVVAKLQNEGVIGGLISLGGSAGTTIGTTAMRALPVGVPKLMVSTLASGNTQPYVDTKDITMMYSVVDIAGINRLSRQILTNAAGAIAGMVTAEVPAADCRYRNIQRLRNT